MADNNCPHGFIYESCDYDSCREICALRAEVARLRELLRDLAGTEEEGDLISGHVVMSKKEVATIRAEVERLRGELAKTLRAWDDGAAARTAEIAALKAENQKMHHDWMADHAELEHLKDELDKYTAPLTYEQAQDVCSRHRAVITEGDAMDMDAAIRRVRRGE